MTWFEDSDDDDDDLAEPFDKTENRRIFASGCGLLACLILFAMFAIIIWRAIQ